MTLWLIVPVLWMPVPTPITQPPTIAPVVQFWSA